MKSCIFIRYPNGQMWLSLYEFFPCLIKDARIVFPLINEYAAKPEKEKLREYLTGYAVKREKEIKDMEEDRRHGYRRSGRNYQHTQALYKRALRNLQFLED